MRGRNNGFDIMIPPINFTDPLGLSREDIVIISNTFNDYVNNLVNNGQRLPENPPFSRRLPDNSFLQRRTEEDGPHALLAFYNPEKGGNWRRAKDGHERGFDLRVLLEPW
jgi:hypothetical protein